MYCLLWSSQGSIGSLASHVQPERHGPSRTIGRSGPVCPPSAGVSLGSRGGPAPCRYPPAPPRLLIAVSGDKSGLPHRRSLESTSPVVDLCSCTHLRTATQPCSRAPRALPHSSVKTSPQAIADTVRRLVHDAMFRERVTRAACVAARKYHSPGSDERATSGHPHVRDDRASPRRVTHAATTRTNHVWPGVSTTTFSRRRTKCPRRGFVR